MKKRITYLTAGFICFFISLIHVNAFSINSPSITGVTYISDTSAKITLTSNMTDDKCKLEINNMTSGEYKKIDIKSTSYTFENLKPNYTYHISARNNCTNYASVWSNDVIIYNYLGKPNLYEIASGNGTLTLKYATNNNPQSIDIYNYVTKKSISTENLKEYKFTNLENKKVYNFAIRNRYKSGKVGYWSEPLSAAPEYSTPTIKSISATTNSVTLTYSTNAKPQSLKLYVYDATNKKSVKTITVSNLETYKVTGLESNTTYTFRLANYYYNSDKQYVTGEAKRPGVSITTKKKVVKNGWDKDHKHYYKNDVLQKNKYIDYIYLDSKGNAKKKIGSFSATLYGATAWPVQDLKMAEKAKSNSKKVGEIKAGKKITILSEENKTTKYIKVKYGNKTGYVDSNKIYINLPDIIPNMKYEITNAKKSIYKSAGKNLPDVTGKNLYEQKLKYNKKIGKNSYYAPLLYPVAKQLQKAYNKAKKDGYNLKVYDSYRPYSVSKKINKQFGKLYNSSSKVRNKVNYDSSKKYWGKAWFLAPGVSMHNRGIALDITITDKKGNELKAQTTMHTLDTRSLRKYNNKNAKKLSKIMTDAGFETLESEWWHFQENSYKNSPYTSFKVK